MALDRSQVASDAQRPSAAELIDRLSRFEGPPEHFLANLLAVQCHLAGALAGAILRATSESSLEVLSVYPPLPQGGTAPVWLAQAVESAGQVLTGGRNVVRPLHTEHDLYGAPARQHLVLVPIRGATGIRGLGAFVVEPGDSGGLVACQERLELTTPLLSLYEMRLTLQRRQSDMRRLRMATETLVAVNEHDRFAGAAMTLCNEAASRWNCDRVSLGFLKGRYVQLKAMSHTEKFSRKMKIVQDIESAMEECLDQDLEILLPAAPDCTYVHRATDELSRAYGPNAVLSLPLRKGGDVVAVLMLERPQDRPFDLEEIESLRLACDLIIARLSGLHDTDRWIGAKAMAAVRKGASLAVGPKHTWIKLTAIAASALLLFMIFVKGDYVAESPFVLEAVQRQIIAAPFDGFLKTVHVKVGEDVVANKTVLATLDTSELRWQLAAAQADRNGYLTQAAQAMRDGKTAEAQVAQAQADKSAAQVALLEYRLKHAELTSPISGKVVQGDLERQIGAPVKIGDGLFEISPLEALRAEINVSEDEIGDVREGFPGELADASHPGEKIRFVVERVNPVAEVVNNSNVFKVRARLEELRPWMRPGMEGMARIELGRKPYGELWTRRVVNWVRMKLWL